MSRVYEITVTDSATYYIKADDIEIAQELAVEWFSEREPKIDIQPDPDVDENLIYEVRR